MRTWAWRSLPGTRLVRKGPSLKVRLEELKKLADKRGASYDEATKDLETFMVAQRDLELAGETGTREPGEIKGVHPEESNRVIEAIQRKYGQDFKGLMEVADSVREWGDEMILQPLLQAGFIDDGNLRQDQGPEPILYPLQAAPGRRGELYRRQRRGHRGPRAGNQRDQGVRAQGA